jgi:hypothetical protein
MSDNEKNKIDAVVDEVLESKRLKQGVGFMFKSVLGLVITGFILLVLLVMTGIVR